MGNFNDRGNRGGGFRGGNGGGKPRFGGKPSFGGNRGGDRREVSMHKAVCDECHKSCEVPFRPSSDKPIYCNDCFGEKRGNEAPRRDFGNDRGSKKEFGSKPNFSKPVNQSNNDDLKKQLSEVNSKLDRLINAIEKMLAPKISTPTVTVKKTVVKAPAKVTVKKVIAKAPVKKVVKKGKIK